MYADALAWAQDHLDHSVAEVVPLTGGRTSAMLALRDDRGRATVLRLITEEPWRTHGGELVTREAITQVTLAGSDVPAPGSLATDPSGAATGHPAHLMTLLPGSPDETRCDDGSLEAMADLLASIHRVVAIPAPRDYQSWAWPAKWVVPGWAGRPDLWQRAFDLLAEEPPGFEPRFLHRDFGPHNLLWAGDTITGVVDWVETSTAAAYTHATGVRRQAYWDVMDVVGFLPPPGREPMFDDPDQLARLEEHLAWAMAGGA